MIWRPKHPAFADCALCHKPIRASHPPYIISKDSRIFGPYHPECIDQATLQIDPDAWRRRHAPRGGRGAPEGPSK